MCDPNQYDLALSFWTISFEYLMLVENVARETVTQGNTWLMTKDWDDGEMSPLPSYSSYSRRSPRNTRLLCIDSSQEAGRLIWIDRSLDVQSRQRRRAREYPVGVQLFGQLAPAR